MKQAQRIIQQRDCDMGQSTDTIYGVAPHGYNRIMIRNLTTKPMRRPSFRFNNLNVHLVSTVTALIGLLTLLSAGSPTLAGRLVILDDAILVLIQQEASVAAAVLGGALLILASSLWRRKRSGWLLTIVLLVIAAILHLLRGPDYQETLIALLLSGWLFSLRREFHARSDPPSVQRGLLLMAGAVVFTLVYTALGFTLLDGHYEQTPAFVAAMGQAARVFTAPGTLSITPVTSFGVAFVASAYTIMLITVTSALVLLSRSVVVREPATADERSRATAIVEAHGRSSVARMTLLDDKSYYFSKGGSVVAYVAKNGFAVALGDPIGPPDDIDAAIGGFRDYARRNGWQAAFYQVKPDHLERYHASGMRSLPIGQEAVVDLNTFTLSGKARKSLRQHINRVRERGYRTVIHNPPIGDALYDTLHDISDEWLAGAGGEKRFSLGWFHEEYIRPVPIITVYNPDDEIVAFANILPEYQLNETTIDLMRHREQMGSGVMDFLFVSLFHWAQEQGYDSFNLGLVALAGWARTRTTRQLSGAFTICSSISTRSTTSRDCTTSRISSRRNGPHAILCIRDWCTCRGCPWRLSARIAVTMPSGPICVS